MVVESATHEVAVRAEQKDRRYELDRRPVARDKWADVIGEGERYTGPPAIQTEIDDSIGIVVTDGKGAQYGEIENRFWLVLREGLETLKGGRTE